MSTKGNQKLAGCTGTTAQNAERGERPQSRGQAAAQLIPRRPGLLAHTRRPRARAALRAPSPHGAARGRGGTASTSSPPPHGAPGGVRGSPAAPPRSVPGPSHRLSGTRRLPPVRSSGPLPPGPTGPGSDARVPGEPQAAQGDPAWLLGKGAVSQPGPERLRATPATHLSLPQPPHRSRALLSATPRPERRRGGGSPSPAAGGGQRHPWRSARCGVGGRGRSGARGGAEEAERPLGALREPPRRRGRSRGRAPPRAAAAERQARARGAPGAACPAKGPPRLRRPSPAAAYTFQRPLGTTLIPLQHLHEKGSATPLLHKPGEHKHSVSVLTSQQCVPALAALAISNPVLLAGEVCLRGGSDATPQQELGERFPPREANPCNCASMW
ncbi:translation initiation factor IF-2-like [Vidua macroura]|uniref:translation initiation factor IF-2-like n=1 Tax=Vidua macroura TaxID=187451 RepID=UPI0023A7B873|nr:translation initiation factor IF-2-like [Vidua macroura]